MSSLFEHKVALFIISAFVLINGKYPSLSSLSPHMPIPSCRFLSHWFSTVHERGWKKCLYLMKTHDHFLRMICMLGSIQRGSEGLFSSASVQVKHWPAPHLMDDTWMLFAVATPFPPGNKEEVGTGDSGIQHATSSHKLCRTLCPVNFWFSSLCEQQ